MKKLESRYSEVVDSLKELINSGFAPALHMEIEYYIGEDNQGTKGLYFAISSDKIGVIYAKFEELYPDQTPMDIEDEFLNKAINDFVQAGIAFIGIQTQKENIERNLTRETHSPVFKNNVPRRLLFVN